MLSNYGITASGVGGVDATGGTTSISSGFKYHTFTSNGTFSILSGPAIVDIVVVGGGGGGAGGSKSRAYNTCYETCYETCYQTCTQYCNDVVYWSEYNCGCYDDNMNYECTDCDGGCGCGSYACGT